MEATVLLTTIKKSRMNETFDGKHTVWLMGIQSIRNKKQSRYITLFFVGLLLLLCLSLPGCESSTDPEEKASASHFDRERKVTIIGYDSDAMEPFISKDDRYLFFNSHKGAHNKDIFYAEKINDTTFVFKGEVQGVNSDYADANPTMDAENHFYFISTRHLDTGNQTLFGGIFDSGRVRDLREIKGTINIPTPYWFNMGVEIEADGRTMWVSSARFNAGENFPSEGNIRFAVKTDSLFNIPPGESDILKNINTDESIQYAGEVSNDGLEIFYSQVTLSDPPVFKLLYATRPQTDAPFGKPMAIEAPFKNDPQAFVEAPTLSADGKRLYYHKRDNDVFAIFMLRRD